MRNIHQHKKYIVYTNAFDDACRVQLLQEHDGTEFPIVFLLHIFTETQRKWSTTKQEAYGVYYVITKWNYYLQGADFTVKNGHKPLAKFLNEKNANNKVNRWSLELATYNITIKWISGAKNKAANCLSQLVELPTTPPATVNMLTVTYTDGPASNTRSCTKSTLLILPPPHTQMFHQRFLQKQLQHSNPLQQTDWKHYSKCRGLTHSVDKFLNIYWTVKHHNMKQMFLPTWKDCCINMSWTLVNNTPPSLSPNPGSIQF